MNSLEGCKLELEYPCMWQYKAIGKDRNLLEIAINEIFKGCTCEISYSNASKTGKYHSYAIDLEVPDEESRLGYYKLLNTHEHILMVI